MPTSDSPTSTVVVLAREPAVLARAEELARQLNLPLQTESELENKRGEDATWYLCVDSSGLSIQQLSRKAAGPVKVDFVGGKMGFRRQRQEATPDLVKAAGIKPGIRPLVWDLTAGLGQDAFTLARYGCQVVMFERHPVVHALLEDGLMRANMAAADGDEELEAIIRRMALLSRDSREILAARTLPPELEEKAQVIYIDTMFPERSKSAKVKKEMQLFQHLVGANSDADELFELALAAEPHRLVVKRPRHAPPLANRKPSLQFKGKAIRFDVYPLRRIAD